MVGAWLGDDPKINKREVENLIKLAREGYVDIAAVGNEVMYRGDLTEDELLEFIAQVKKAIPGNIPVGYVDAYYEFSDHPRITEACDVILANCYPYWEGCHQDYSLIYMKDMYNRALRAANGKESNYYQKQVGPVRVPTLMAAFPSADKLHEIFYQYPKMVQGRWYRNILFFLF